MIFCGVSDPHISGSGERVVGMASAANALNPAKPGDASNGLADSHFKN